MGFAVFKLTSSDIPKIRELRRSGMDYRSIAEQFGVSGTAILSVCLGRTWRHLGLGAVKIPTVARGERSYHFENEGATGS
jgi:hypothetical protein